MTYQFTEEQLDELEKIFGLTRTNNHLPIKDGIVVRSDTVWWKAETGPQHVPAAQHWPNIKDYPHLYSHKQPPTKVTYL